MANQTYGKILDIDLSSGKIEKKDIDPDFAKKCIGGMGFSNKLLYDEVGPEIDPLSPENIIIFANGALTGTPAPYAGRMEITTRNPLTGNTGTGNTGGVWGAMLRHAGYQMMVVRNRSEKPIYIWIDDDTVEIRDAGHLWGKDTYETSEILERELPHKAPVLSIGQAGENLIPYACPINEYHHGANRTGAGAVMGSKKLKAIAVRGTRPPKPARPEEFQDAIKHVKERLEESRRALEMPGAYTGGHDALSRYLEKGGLRVKNFQSGFLPQLIETRGREVAMKYVTKKEATCYGCPKSCFDVAEVKEGKFAGTRCGRPAHCGIACAFGANCAIDNLPAIWACKEATQRLGFDYVAASGTIAFTMELYQRGILTKKDTDGLELTWGNEDAALQLLRKIASREGFGAVLADGTVPAAARIGRGAERYAMTMKGMDMMAGDPRGHQKLYILCDITNPKGGDNVKGGHNFVDPDSYDPNWWVDKLDMFEDAKRKIFKSNPEEITSTWEGKALMCKWAQDLYSILNAMGICFSVVGSRLILGPASLSRLYSAYTGWDTTPAEIMSAAERVFTIFKAYAVRQGLSRKDDNWPERFYEEQLPDGPAKGIMLSKETIDSVLDDYYEVRGWDKKLGTPSEAKLKELGLDDITKDLQRRGKLPVSA